MTIAVTYPNETFTLGPIYGYTTNFNGSRYNFSYVQYNRLRRGQRSGYRQKDRNQFLALNGYLPQHSYSAVSHSESVVFSKGSKNADGSRPWVDSIGCTLGGGYGSYADVTTLANAKSANANRLAAALNGEVRNQYYSTFETLYEGRKTKDMILKAVQTTVQAARAVRRGRFKEAAKHLGLKKPPKGVSPKRDFAGNWLEYRYGWGPLYYTVYGVMQQAYDSMKNQEPVHEVRKTRAYALPTYVSGVTYNITQSDSSGDYLGSYFTRSRRDKATLYSVRKAYYRIHNPSLASSTSMGLTNPALVAWELVPLSFVVDWFVNVSDCLEQFDAWAGKTYLSGTLTHTTRGETRQSVEKTSGTGTFKKAGWYLDNFVYMDRVIVSSPPTVMPKFDLSLSPKRLLDGIALLGKIFK